MVWDQTFIAGQGRAHLRKANQGSTYLSWHAEQRACARWKWSTTQPPVWCGMLEAVLHGTRSNLITGGGQAAAASKAASKGNSWQHAPVPAPRVARVRAVEAVHRAQQQGGPRVQRTVLRTQGVAQRLHCCRGARVRQRWEAHHPAHRTRLRAWYLAAGCCSCVALIGQASALEACAVLVDAQPGIAAGKPASAVAGKQTTCTPALDESQTAGRRALLLWDMVTSEAVWGPVSGQGWKATGCCYNAAARQCWGAHHPAHKR